MKKLLSVLLAAVFVFCAFPLSVFSDWEDGMECWSCFHYHWDEYCCGMCGACSPECTDTDCWVSTHCHECGACRLGDEYFCSECRICPDCYSGNGWHCSDCYECYYTSEEELCGICWACGDCRDGGLCDGCGFCLGCAELELMHCEECGNCYSEYEICQFENTHCEECCVICEQCENCLYEEGVELCEDCGLCVYCCLDNAADEGCFCGEYCTENSDWYDHICPDCGQAFCEIEMCETCELCLDCCEGNSGCADSPPLCFEDDEYDYHFCEDCGECFHNSDVCDGCISSGLLLCESCCKMRLEEEGCDCTDRCISDYDIDEHIASVHMNAGGSHDAAPQNSWEISDTHHWRACRFCEEASHITSKAPHVYNNYGVCTVCHFDSQQNILILKQPKSVVAKVSNVNEDGFEELLPYNNLRTFSVAAKGTSALTYQWYYSRGGEWIKLTDSKSDDPWYVTKGSKTNTLTVSVEGAACYDTIGYRCEITDENGNKVVSNVAYIKAQHVYGKYVASKGALIGTIMQAGTGNNIGRYETKGHYVLCIGDGCEAEKIEAHNYGKQKRLIIDTKTSERWYEQICQDCGFKNYYLDHIHYFYDPVTFECEIDTTYQNTAQHRLKCLWPGCDKTTLESHNELGWQYHGTPYSNSDKVGVPYKQCDICGYDTAPKLQTYSASEDKMVASEWTQRNDLVFVQFGYASCDTVVNGSKLVIGFSPSEYAKEQIIKLKYPTVVGWKVGYYCDRSPTGSVIDIDVTDDFTFEKIGDELKWSLTVPLFSGRQGGGILTFTPIVEECKHNSGTRLKNVSEPICTKDGYTGDTVCAGCDGVIFYGEVIESSHKHEGNLTLIPGTSKAGSCEQRGYEGTYLCDHCNQKVRGKSTSKQHNGKTVLKNAVAFTCTEFGYSGDLYCECGVLLQEGEILAPRHTDLRLINADKASCQKKGYTGDWKCYDCDQIVKYGYNVSKSEHAWSTWGKINDTAHRHTCVVAGCGAYEIEAHNDANRDLKCDDCGYSWGSDSPTIRSISFNIDIPEIGQKPDYSKFDGVCYYSDGTGANMKNGVEWFDVTANKRFTPGGVGQEFKEGHVYRVTIHFRSEEGYEFVEEGVLAGAINGKEAVIEYSTGDFAGISYTFEALAHDHDIERIDKVAASCTDAGKETYYHCKSCGKYYEDAGAKTEISDIEKWGIVQKLGHAESELKSNSTHHFRICTRCNQEIAGSKSAHQGGVATCQTKAKCADCGALYGSLVDHNTADSVWGFIDPTGHAHMCLTEDCYFVGEVLPHRSSGPATEEKDEVCLDCGYVIAKAIEKTEYMYSYYPGEADGSPDSDIVESGTEITLLPCMFEAPAGKRFKAWAAGSPDGALMQPGEKITITAETYIYAIWEDVPSDPEDTTTPADSDPSVTAIPESGSASVQGTDSDTEEKAPAESDTAKTDGTGSEGVGTAIVIGAASAGTSGIAAALWFLLKKKIK